MYSSAPVFLSSVFVSPTPPFFISPVSPLNRVYVAFLSPSPFPGRLSVFCWVLTFTEACLLGGLPSTKINPVSRGRRSEYFILCFMMCTHAWCRPELPRQEVLSGAALPLALSLDPLSCPVFLRPALYFISFIHRSVSNSFWRLFRFCFCQGAGYLFLFT